MAGHTQLKMQHIHPCCPSALLVPLLQCWRQTQSLTLFRANCLKKKKKAEKLQGLRQKLQTAVICVLCNCPFPPNKVSRDIYVHVGMERIFLFVVFLSLPQGLKGLPGIRVPASSLRSSTARQDDSAIFPSPAALPGKPRHRLHTNSLTGLAFGEKSSYL